MKYEFLPTTEHCTLVPLNYIPKVDYSFLNINYSPDTFQIQSFFLLNNNEDILVTAHTSCGKTLVAEYCIHQQLKNDQRVIYTTPLKTLSNQKYFYFSKMFNTGIITGDISLNTDAPLLIMTTEILHSKVNEVDCSYVIFDEVHYINDKDRGYVWEESLIKFKGNILCLSATIDNKREFADWLGRQRNKHCYVISTKERVIPLEYVIYYEDKGYNLNGEIETKYLSEKEKVKYFIHKKNHTKKNQEKTELQNYFRIKKEKKTNVHSLILWLKEKELLPTILFTFSRNKIDKLSSSLKLDLTTKEEKQCIIDFLNKVNLPNLPQVKLVKEMLVRGIAIHYSTLIPLLKEAVEFLISFSLIKVLFATETFAVGVNMPARSVVFLSLTKISKQNSVAHFRFINSAEFTQMSGRAGRRGLDSKGVVVLTDLERKDTLSLFQKHSLIISQFKVTFNFVLNNEVSFLRRTFLENESDRRNKKILSFLLKESNQNEDIYFFNEETKEKDEQKNEYFRKMEEIFENDLSNFIQENDIIYTKSNHKLKVLKVQDRIIVNDGCIDCLDTEIFMNLPVEYHCDCICHGGNFIYKRKEKDSLDVLYDGIFKKEMSQSKENNQSERSVSKESVILIERDVLGLELTFLNQKNKKILQELSLMEYQSEDESNKEINKLEEDFLQLKIEDLQSEKNEDKFLLSKNKKNFFDDKIKNDLQCEEKIRKNEKDFIFVKDPEEKKVKIYKKDLKHAEKIYKLKKLKQLLKEDDLKLITDYKLKKDFLIKNDYTGLKEACAKRIRVLEDILVVELIFNGLIKNADWKTLCALISCLANRDIKENITNLEVKKESLIKINEFIELLNQKMVGAHEYSLLNESVYAAMSVYLEGMSFFEISEFVNEGIFVKMVMRTDEGIRELREVAVVIGDDELISVIDQIRLRKDECVRESLYVIA